MDQEAPDLSWLEHQVEIPFHKEHYGTHSSQYMLITDYDKYNTTAHCASSKKLPIVVIVHGGFWRSKYSIYNAMDVKSMCKWFQSKGYVSILVEYRRVGQGGEFPAANLDLIASIRHLKKVAEYDPPLIKTNLDTSNITLLGHSAGGNLVLWAGSSSALRPYSDNYPQACESLGCHLSTFEIVAALFGVRLVVAIAPVANVEMACELRLSDEGDATQKFLGVDTNQDFDVVSSKISETCALASPWRARYMWTPYIISSGGRDTDVPQAVIESFWQRHIALFSKCMQVHSQHSVIYKVVDEGYDKAPEADDVMTDQIELHDSNQSLNPFNAPSSSTRPIHSEYVSHSRKGSEFERASSRAAKQAIYIHFPSADHYQLFHPITQCFQETWDLVDDFHLSSTLSDMLL